MTAPRRLSALDAAFVALDARGAPYHVGSVEVFDSLDPARVRAYITACLDRLPRYRQRIQRVPLLGHPVWVDDPDFDADRQIRVAHLPPPGSMRQLDELVGIIFSEGLPADRPPWQTWIVDGLEGDAVALVNKVHHCLVDGIAGVALTESMLRSAPDASIPERLPVARELPSRRALLGAELGHRVRGLATLPRRLPRQPAVLAGALLALVNRGLHPASDAGLNPRKVGRVRILRGWQVELAEIAAIKRRLGVTVNDVVLAIVTGALRRFLLGRGVAVAELKDFRAMVPVSTHARDDHDLAGNRVALLLVRLPVDEPDAERRVRLVAAGTRDHKGRAEAAAGELLVQISDVTVPGLLAGVLGLSTDRRGFNVVVTNVPGPAAPLYLMDARLRSFRPIVNLWPGQSLGIAVLSYHGTLTWGLQADRAVIADLDPFVEDLRRSFLELRAIPAEPVTRTERIAGVPPGA